MSRASFNGTDVSIASQTPNGAMAVEQADLLKEAGLSLRCFVWVHARSEPDVNLCALLAAREVYATFDSVWDDGSENRKIIQRLESLISMDRIL